MKRRIALGAVIAAVALMGSLDTAKADHCRTYGPSYGYSSGGYYAPSYGYSHSSFYRPSYGYNHSSFYRPNYGYPYGRQGITFSFGSGRSGFSFGSYGRSYGNFGGGHSHHGHRH